MAIKKMKRNQERKKREKKIGLIKENEKAKRKMKTRLPALNMIFIEVK